MGIPLRIKCAKYFEPLLASSRAPAKIDETNIYQVANQTTRAMMDELIRETALPDSGLNKIENFKRFYEMVTNEKKSGLILMEHYSNFDLPGLLYFLAKDGGDWGSDFAKKIVAVAGMKLNEQNPIVRAWAEGFTRVVIYPTRSLDKATKNIADETEKANEEKRAHKINLFAMRAMHDCKKRGEVVLVFPAGTRYRPGVPETKKGLREIDSYLRMFDILLLVSINGNCLRLNPADPDNMIMDIIENDTLTFTAHEPIVCSDFRKAAFAELPSDEPDPKQKVIDKIMSILQTQHDAVEASRK